jgi:predicted acetyltransferase
MGHKTPSISPEPARITLERYTQMLPGELKRARELFDKFLAECVREEEHRVRES